jgi:DNA-binding transcriptional LysR family regulator
VSKSVSRLEADLGVRLFHRTTRRLALTERGEQLVQRVAEPLGNLQEAMSGARGRDDEPSGTLKVSMGQAFGRRFLVPLLGDFLAAHPRVLPDWHFDNRQVDIVGEGFDAAIGGGFALAPGSSPDGWRTCTSSPWRRRATWRVARRPASRPTWPSSTASCVARRRRGASAHGRCVRGAAPNNPCHAARVRCSAIRRQWPKRRGWVSASPSVPMPFAFEQLRTGELVRVLPGWYSDAGPLSIYYPSRRLLPAKTRAFSDFVIDRFSGAGFARLVDGR